MTLKFVYGSLMTNPTALETGKAAYINDHEIRLTHTGINKWEPTFANIEEDKGFKAWGVLVDFDPETWAEIRKRERTYTVKDATAISAEGKEYKCETLVLPKRFTTHERPPSARYARMLLKGARYHKFPETVIKKYEHFYRVGPRWTLRLGPLRPLFFRVVRLIYTRRYKKRMNNKSSQN